MVSQRYDCNTRFRVDVYLILLASCSSHLSHTHFDISIPLLISSESAANTKVQSPKGFVI